jgi:prepilin-type N-terminal cleavage/methylation domain-containing protein
VFLTRLRAAWSRRLCLLWTASVARRRRLVVSRLARAERGVTLTETLVTIVVLGIIIGPLGNAVIEFIRLTDQTSVRLTESHDAQIVAAYFAQDVQSLGTRDWSAYPYGYRQSVELNVVATGGLYPCGTASTPDAAVRLAWDDPTAVTGTPQVVRVAYVVVTSGSDRQLHRLRCAGSASVVSDVTIVHDLDVAAPVVSCSTACTSSTVPLQVSLTVQVRDPKDTGAPLVVVLSGQRRQT